MAQPDPPGLPGHTNLGTTAAWALHEQFLGDWLHVTTVQPTA